MEEKSITITKKLLPIIALFLILLLVCLMLLDEPISVSNHYIVYANVDQLDQAADLIITGTTKQSFYSRKHVNAYDESGALQYFYTITEIQVNKVIKNPPDFDPGDTINIIEPIGLVYRMSYRQKITYNNYTEIPKNKPCIIFLSKDSEGKYSVINMELGKFIISSEPQFNGKKDQQDKDKENFRQTVLEKYDLL